MVRELKLQYRDRFNLYSRTLQIAFLAFLSAFLFFKPGHHTLAQGQRFLLDIFFACLVSIFAGFGKVGHNVAGFLFTCFVCTAGSRFCLTYALLALSALLAQLTRFCHTYGVAGHVSS